VFGYSPPESATPAATAETVDLGQGQQGTIEFTPEQSGTTFRIPVVAASKRADTVYTVKMDGNTIWGPTSIPPTDIDDLSPVWKPAQRFETSLTIEISNVARTGGVRTYHALPVGWEEA